MRNWVNWFNWFNTGSIGSIELVQYPGSIPLPKGREVLELNQREVLTIGSGSIEPVAGCAYGRHRPVPICSKETPITVRRAGAEGAR